MSDFRAIVVGLGVQGHKRRQFASDDYVMEGGGMASAPAKLEVPLTSGRDNLARLGIADPLLSPFVSLFGTAQRHQDLLEGLRSDFLGFQTVVQEDLMAIKQAHSQMQAAIGRRFNPQSRAPRHRDVVVEHDHGFTPGGQLRFDQQGAARQEVASHRADPRPARQATDWPSPRRMARPRCPATHAGRPVPAKAP